MNAEVTAENRLDCAKPHGKHHVPSDTSSPTPISHDQNTHKDQGNVQVFVALPREIPVVFFRFSLKLVVELHSGVDPSSSAARHGIQGITEGRF